MTTAAICATREVSWRSSLYRGEQYDPDLGLYYLRARYYNPATGRFLSRDPEDGKAVNPASLHKYLYAFSDPVNLSDPSGRDAVETGLTFALIDTTPLPVLAELAGGAYSTAASYAVQGYLAAAATATTVAAKAADYLQAVEWAKVVTGISKYFICDGIEVAFDYAFDKLAGEGSSMGLDITEQLQEACGEFLGKISGFE